MKPVTLGASGTAEHTVELRHTLAGYADNDALPKVYATPAMISLMEKAGGLALQPFCEPGEITVGTRINIEHRAASPLGARIRAQAEVESFDGRFYNIRVTAHELAPQPKEVGRGTIQRAIVNLEKFRSKMADAQPSPASPQDR